MWQGIEDRWPTRSLGIVETVGPPGRFLQSNIAESGRGGDLVGVLLSLAGTHGTTGLG